MFMRLGARSLKTGIAVTLALILALLLNIKPPTMAGIAAAMATQPSVHRSFRTMIQNIQGNLIGALIAVLLVIFVGSSPVIIGLAMIMIIAIHLKFRLNATLTLSMVTVIVIMTAGTSNEAFLTHAFDRVILVGLGVGSATVVNFLLFPPNYENRLYLSILDQTTDLFKWIRLLSERASDNTKIKDELAKFDDNKLKIENYYHWYKEEREYFRSQRFVKYRRTVIFREMIAATNLLHHILKELDRNENAYRLLPDDFRKTLKEQLTGLMAYHDRVLLKFNGKIRRRQHEEQAKKDYRHKMELAGSFVNHYSQNQTDEWLDLFPLISTIVDYSQHVEHLDLLVNSFQSHHTKSNQIKFNTAPTDER
ncbi:aromatic acid exporter family protein [Sporolactobacillus sp. THM7-4]|nr:aromatic acid exporter family protein [Sporolactobacillus sp. THM7-4]